MSRFFDPGPSTVEEFEISDADLEALQRAGVPSEAANFSVLKRWHHEYGFSFAEIAQWWPINSDPAQVSNYKTAGISAQWLRGYRDADLPIRTSTVIWAHDSGWSHAAHWALIGAFPDQKGVEAYARCWLDLMSQELADAYLCAGVPFAEAATRHIQGNDMTLGSLRMLAALR